MVAIYISGQMIRLIVKILTVNLKERDNNMKLNVDQLKYSINEVEDPDGFDQMGTMEKGSDSKYDFVPDGSMVKREKYFVHANNLHRYCKTLDEALETCFEFYETLKGLDKLLEKHNITEINKTTDSGTNRDLINLKYN